MIRQFVILAILVLANAACTAGAKQDPTATPNPTATPTPAPEAVHGVAVPGNHLNLIESSGEARWFMVHIPPSYLAGEPMAVVLNFHGAGSSAREQEQISGMSEKADEEGFIVVYPQSLGGTWNFATESSLGVDLIFVRDLIEHLLSELSVDPKRVYATGFSNGGGLVERLGCQLSDKIAAIAPVAGAYAYWEPCEPERPVPAVFFHGTNDTAAPYEGMGFSMPGWAADWAAHNGCDVEAEVFLQQGTVVGEKWRNCDEGATVSLYTIEGGGHVWPGSPYFLTSGDVEATEAMWDFFEAHPMP